MLDKYRINTDFADELGHNSKSIKTRNRHINELSFKEVIVLKDDLLYGKKKGKYLSFELEELYQSTSYQKHLELIAKELKKMIKEICPIKKPAVLIVGLGNEAYTPDALGPRVIKKIEATSHLIKYKEFHINTKVSCLIPGVMALTGLESARIIQALIKQFNFDLVIVLDSLATRNIKRLNRVIQITDTGISPGHGVGNYRLELNRKTLKIPVIAIGVGTVVSSKTLAIDTLNKAEKSGVSITKADYQQVLNEDPYELVLTSKSIDGDIEFLSSLIANSINLALNPKLNA